MTATRTRSAPVPDRVFSALADPTRAAIVELLAQRDLPAGDIAAHFDVSGPAISRHLRVLRDAGVATYTPDAQRRVYRLDPMALAPAEAWIGAMRESWERRLDRLGDHLDAMATHKPRRSTK